MTHLRGSISSQLLPLLINIVELVLLTQAFRTTTEEPLLPFLLAPQPSAIKTLRRRSPIRTLFSNF